MLQRINNIENIGVFKKYSFDQTRHGNVEFGRTNIVYGKNSSGKSTLVGILKSLSNNEQEIIEGRRTVGSQSNKQRIELLLDHETYLFDGRWNRAYPNITIFNQDYINENIYLGDAITPENRRNQFNIIVGKDNITINLELNKVTKELRDIAKEKKDIEVIINSKLKGVPSLQDYLKMDKNIDIESIKNRLDNLIKQRNNYYSRAKINKLSMLSTLEIPVFDIKLFKVILSTDNNHLLSSYEKKVKTYMDKRGLDINWIENGYERSGESTCAFCNQPLDTSDIYQVYREYFNVNLKEYSNKIKHMDGLIKNDFSRDKALEYNLLIEKNKNLYSEIKQIFYIDKDYKIDRNEIEIAIVSLFNHISLLMEEKVKNPFSQIDYVTEINNLNKEYIKAVELVKNYNKEINNLNHRVNDYKKEPFAFDLEYIVREIGYYENLAILKDRDNEELINRYNDLNKKISSLYIRKNELKNKLSKINNFNIKQFNNILNDILTQLNANFKVEYIYPKFNEYGIEVNYKLIIRNQGIQTRIRKNESIKTPNFKNTLSGGEKNLLALAYFIASIKMDTNSTNRIIVFDDPTNYSDNTKKALIAKQIMKLSRSDNQIIVLTHDIEFSKRFWEENLHNDVAGLYIDYNDESSEIISRDAYRERKY